MFGYAAESGSGLSCGDAAGTNTMPETVAVDSPPAEGAATVSASALAQHLDCSRTFIGKLEADGVIQRQGNGFLLDQSRVAYLRYLRRERRQSSRSEADAEHASRAEVCARCQAGAAGRCRCRSIATLRLRHVER